MEQRGKKTNNTLAELKSVLADIESGKCSTDGYSSAIADIKEDIAQLELEQKAEALVKIYPDDSEIVKAAKELTKTAYMGGFKEGIEWQKEQYKQLMSLAFFAEEKLRGTSAEGLASLIKKELELLQDGGTYLIISK